MNPLSLLPCRGAPLASLLVGVSLLLGSCSRDGEPLRAGAPTAPGVAGRLESVTRLQEQVSPMLLRNAGVVGTGVSLDARGAPVLVVLVERAAVAGVPARIGGVTVETEVVGPLRPFSLTARYRPVPIGTSAGNASECLPGTIGCVLESGNKEYLLSANHVFARQNQAAIGEWIVQPSRPDSDPACGPPPSNTMVARLADFEPVAYDGNTPNVMDAAIAVLTTNDVTCATLPAFYGLPSSQPATAQVGVAVLKVGRTTELTRGSVKAVNVKVRITFPSGTALFVNQVLTSKDFAAFGDSGSLVVTDDGHLQPIGIVIGGGSTGQAIVSPIGPILDRFHVTICGR